MEQLLSKLCEFGAVGIVAAVCLWQYIGVTNKLLGVIEANTRAMVELKEIIKNKVQ